MSRWTDGALCDLCAAGLSSLCILHCLAVPVLAGALPVVSHVGDSHLIHIGLLMLAAPVTLWVVWRVVGSETRHRTFLAFALGGLGLMIAAVAIHELHAWETPLTVVGGVLLGGAHLWRWFNLRTVAASDSC